MIKDIKTLIFVFSGFLFVLLGCKSTPKSLESGNTLDNAVSGAALQIESALAEKTAIAVLNIKTSSESVADFIIEELIGKLVNGKKLVVTERRKLESIRAEMTFQLSGDVSEESLQSIGKMLGAEYIISGSFTVLGDSYRLRVQAVNVSTAAIVVQYSAEVAINKQITFLIEQDKAKELKEDNSSPIPAAREPTTRKKGEPYKIGDWGPAGGIVFYDKGNESDGWRYLEAAPKELEMKLGWFPGLEDESIKDFEKVSQSFNTSMGTGKKNTENILFLNDQINQRFADKRGISVKEVPVPETPYWIAAYINTLEYEDFTDWFLPSIDELELMEKNLWKNGLGGFTFGSNYWSSSITGELEKDSIVAWVYDFYGDYAKKRGVESGVRFNVRPIRSFK